MELNIDEVAQLAELVSEHDLSELTVETDGIKIKLRRGAKVSAAHMTMAAPMALQAPVPATPEAEEDDSSSDALTIRAPIVGTFYAAPAPDTPSFVKPGDRVEPETVVCVVEAMKVMNEIKAEVSGVIRRSMVENATPVEYGQPLFEVDPA